MTTNTLVEQETSLPEKGEQNIAAVIKEAVAKEFEILVEKFWSNNMSPIATRARAAAVYVMNDLFIGHEYFAEALGLFRGLDPRAVEHCYTKAAILREEDPDFKVIVEKLLEMFSSLVPSKMITIDFIKEEVANDFGVSVEDLESRNRAPKVFRPRQVAMFLISKLIPRSTYPDIGRSFGGRDHSTVIHALRDVEERMDHDPEFKKRVEALENLILYPEEGKRQAREVVEELEGAVSSTCCFTNDDIVKTVAAFYGLKPEELQEETEDEDILFCGKVVNLLRHRLAPDQCPMVTVQKRMVAMPSRRSFAEDDNALLDQDVETLWRRLNSPGYFSLI